MVALQKVELGMSSETLGGGVLSFTGALFALKHSLHSERVMEAWHRKGQMNQ